MAKILNLPNWVREMLSHQVARRGSSGRLKCEIHMHRVIRE